MREFWTWFLISLAAAALIAIGVLGPPVHAEPAGTFPACTTAEALRAELTGKGAVAWSIDGLRGVRFLSIVNHLEPVTSYQADSVLAAFSRDGRLTMFLIRGDCVTGAPTMDGKAGIALMRDVFGVTPRDEGGMTPVVRRTR